MCKILYINIERLSEMVIYDECGHTFSMEAIMESCKRMVEESLIDKVDKCPLCITEKVENRKIIGKIDKLLL